MLLHNKSNDGEHEGNNRHDQLEPEFNLPHPRLPSSLDLPLVFELREHEVILPKRGRALATVMHWCQCFSHSGERNAGILPLRDAQGQNDRRIGGRRFGAGLQPAGS